MGPSDFAVSGAGAASAPPEKATTSATSITPKSKSSTESESPGIRDEMLLRMLQTMCNRINQRKIPGIEARRATINQGGEKTAVIILNGCIWDDDGDLLLATDK